MRSEVTSELSSSIFKGLYGERAGMESEQTGFPSFQGMGAEAEDGLQAEAKMLLVTQCPTEQEKGLAAWCLLYTVLQNRQGKYPSVGRTVNDTGRGTHM